MFEFIIILAKMFHPFLVTPVLVFLVFWFIPDLITVSKRTAQIGLWTAVGIFVLDTALAYKRVQYAKSLPTDLVVEKTVPLPSRLIYLGRWNGCDSFCHDMLIYGDLEEVVIPNSRGWNGDTSPALNYKFAKSSQFCPVENLKLVDPSSVATLEYKGLCPVIEGREYPTEGIFIVEESTFMGGTKPSMQFVTQHLEHSAPYSTFQYRGREVQERRGGTTTVLAHERSYGGPSYIGPLLGCWSRDAKLFWVLPRGDAGCGLWRLVIIGGAPWQKTAKRDENGSIKWFYADVFNSAANSQSQE